MSFSELLETLLLQANEEVMCQDFSYKNSTSAREKRVQMKIFSSILCHLTMLFYFCTKNDHLCTERKKNTKRNKYEFICMMLSKTEIIHVFIQSIRSKNMNTFCSFFIHWYRTFFSVRPWWCRRSFYIMRKFMHPPTNYTILFTH